MGVTRRITIGRSNIDSMARLYLGAELNRSVMFRNGHYFSYTAAAGLNYNREGWTDNSFLVAINWMSSLYNFSSHRLRQLAGISYTAISNQRKYDNLYLNNELGLEKFNTDSAFGTQRLSGNIETMVFSNWQLFGFRIGFFSFARTSLLSTGN
ncbi:MAG: hypothetical protein QM664_15330, partial [Flavihumibacter sp.]